MLAIERQRMILDRVVTESSIRVVDLADSLHVSGETIRRDLLALEQQGLVRRVHGGAVDARQDAGDRLFQERETIRIEEKRAIGLRAAELVQDGDIIAVDVGTTALVFCEALRSKRRLTVITPSIKAALLLRQTSDARVIVTGGELQEDEPYLAGYLAEAALRQFHVTRAFISAGGIALDTGITDYHDGEVQMRKVMLQCASQVTVLADSSKMGVRAFAVVGPLRLMDTLITDAGLHSSMQQKLEQLGIEVLVAEVPVRK